jgi:hypothetical protein
VVVRYGKVKNDLTKLLRLKIAFMGMKVMQTTLPSLKVL